MGDKVLAGQTCPSKYPVLASFLKFATVLGATWCRHVRWRIDSVTHTDASVAVLTLLAPLPSKIAHLGPELEDHLAGRCRHGHNFRVRALGVGGRFRGAQPCTRATRMRAERATERGAAAKVAGMCRVESRSAKDRGSDQQQPRRPRQRPCRAPCGADYRQPVRRGPEVSRQRTRHASARMS